MSDENEQSETVETPEIQSAEHQQEDMVPRSEMLKAAKKRDERTAALREAQAKLAKYEADQVTAQEESLRQQGENEKIIATRDEALASVTAELEQMKWGQRFNTTVQAVTAAAAQFGLDSAVVEGLLLREKQVRGTDVAPEELSDDGVAEFIDAMRASAPSLFKAQNVGGTPGVASSNGGVSEVAALAQRMGARNQRKQS